jgi:hypothetical protein
MSFTRYLTTGLGDVSNQHEHRRRPAEECRDVGSDGDEEYELTKNNGPTSRGRQKKRVKEYIVLV